MSEFAIQTVGTPWTRSRSGPVAGVCEGLGHQFGISPWIFRLAFVVAAVGFGTGFAVYLILAICLPREDLVWAAERKRILGVCYRFSLKTGLPVGLVRLLTALAALASFGLALVGYVVLHFILPDETQVLTG